MCKNKRILGLVFCYLCITVMKTDKPLQVAKTGLIIVPLILVPFNSIDAIDMN